jgi:hypothetical protein
MGCDLVGISVKLTREDTETPSYDRSTASYILLSFMEHFHTRKRHRMRLGRSQVYLSLSKRSVRK